MAQIFPRWTNRIPIVVWVGTFPFAVSAAGAPASVVQPLILPLFGAHSAVEVLGLMTREGALPGEEALPGYELVRATWKKSLGEGGFEAQSRRALHDGLFEGTEGQPGAPSLLPQGLSEALAALSEPRDTEGLELVFRPSPAVFDGRFANNGWLQEFPDAITKITWDNAAVLSPKTTARFGVANEDVVRLAYRDRSVELPVWILPGHSDDTVSVTVAKRVLVAFDNEYRAPLETGRPDPDPTPAMQGAADAQAAQVEKLRQMPLAENGVPLEDVEYRAFPVIGSRVAVWSIAQLHLLFAAFVLAVPIFALIIEFIGFFTGDKRYDALAYEFTKLLSVSFSLTATLGAALTFMLIALYPRFTHYLMHVFSPTFIPYVLLFFAEAGFLYTYYYGWGKFSPKIHLALGVGLNVVGTGIMVIANAWLTFMTSPNGISESGALISTWDAVRNFTWLMGLKGYARSGLRQHWHVYGVIRDTSVDAFTPTLGFATKVVSVNVLVFFVLIGFVFWLAGLAGKKDWEPSGGSVS